MIPRFDIFQLENGGDVMWLEAVDSLDQAQSRVQELGKAAPSEYIVMNQRTGEKIRIKSEIRFAEPTSPEVRYPIWESAYLEVLREGDPHELLAKVAAAETAMVERLRQLNSSSNGFAERSAIKQASDVMLNIKTDKLNFPAWNSSQEACS